MPLEVAEVGDLMDEDVSPAGQRDQVVVHGGVAGEHHGAVRGVEPVRQGRNRPAVHHRDGGDPDRGVLEDDDRDLGGPSAGRDGDVGRPDQRARVRHAGVQRHDVQVVGVAGQDVLDQVSRAGGGPFRVDRGLAMEGGVTDGSESGRDGP